jgi:hypothetical protein
VHRGDVLQSASRGGCGQKAGDAEHSQEQQQQCGWRWLHPQAWSALRHVGARGDKAGDAEPSQDVLPDLLLLLQQQYGWQGLP